MTSLILASTSEARRMLLTRAGVEFEAMRPDVDEAALKSALREAEPAIMAQSLAQAKAVSLANRFPDRMIIGADQVLSFKSRIFDKPKTPNEARLQLGELRGGEHWLETAVCCALGAEILWRHLGRAKLVMRNFTDGFLSQYLGHLGSDVLTSVGAYKLEGPGVQLFDRIEGDYFTILGLPLLPLLAFLRSQGVIGS